MSLLSDYARYTTKKAKQKLFDRYNELNALKRKDAIRFVYRQIILRAAKVREIEIEITNSIFTEWSHYNLDDDEMQEVVAWLRSEGFILTNDNVPPGVWLVQWK
jgi:hypothetical protein